MATEKRGGPPRAMARIIGGVTRPVLGKRGFVGADIVADWATIVGADLASAAGPERMAFDRDGVATLHIRVASGAAASDIQHQEPQIVERINAHYGYRAVGRLRIVQGPLPRKPRRHPPLPPPDPAAAKVVEATVAGVEDDELRRKLQALGCSIAARAARKGRL